MTMTFVGLDVSKRQIDEMVRLGEAALSVPQTEDGIAGLVSQQRVLKPTLIVLEATGGYELPAATAFALAALPVAIVNPRSVRISPRRWGDWRKRTRSTRPCSHVRRACPPGWVTERYCHILAPDTLGL